MTPDTRRGVFECVAAYALWGLFPIYYKWLTHVPALEVIGHRIAWSCVALLLLIAVMRDWSGLWRSLRKDRVLITYTIAAVLVGINWLTFVWAVSNNYVVQASLGYFINPLISVLLGTIFLRERLRAWQWVAVGLTALGVLYLALSYSEGLWIALTLAFSFGLYGLVKKTAPLGAIHGLWIETAILLPAALLYVAYLASVDASAFPAAGLGTMALLIGAGFLTTVPLLLFASATKRVPLSIIGLMQYIAPTLQFLIGVLLYAEPFGQAQLIGFGIVWIGLAIFSTESYFARRRIPVAVVE